MGIYGPIFSVLTTFKFRPSIAELEELETIMNNGDKLPNTVASLETKVKRRALLVAVQYDGDWRFKRDEASHMLSSPRDVLPVYHMLLNCGYEAQNIRILVAGVVDSSLSHPTKKNILDSLEWLSHRYIL